MPSRGKGALHFYAEGDRREQERRREEQENTQVCPSSLRCSCNVLDMNSTRDRHIHLDRKMEVGKYICIMLL